MGVFFRNMLGGSKRSRMERIESCIQRKNTFIEAQTKYNESQKQMGASIKQFVVAHSSSPSTSSPPPLPPPPPKGLQTLPPPDVAAKEEEKEDEEHHGDGETIRLNSLEEALRQVEAEFQKVYDSGRDVCTSLEQVENNGHKNNNNKLMRSLTKCRSTKLKTTPLARSFSMASNKVGDNFLTPDFKDESSAAAVKRHSSTLEELYVREKQLNKEVKILAKEEKLGGELEVEIAKESARESFNKIQKLINEELQPQLLQLRNNLNKNWTLMSDCHGRQSKIMSDMVKSHLYSPLPEDRVCDSTHMQATKALKEQVLNWQAKLVSYIASQKGYIQALEDWGKHPRPLSCKDNNNEDNNNDMQTLITAWLKNLREMSVEEVRKAMHGFGERVGELMELQRKEHDMKIKVEKLDAKLFRRLMKKKKNKENELEGLRKELEKGKMAYQDSKKKTQQVAEDLVKVKFEQVFKSLADFSTSF